MKVCLIRPARLMVQGAVAQAAIPPLGIALISGALKAAGHEVTVIDCIAAKPQQFVTLQGKLNSQKLPVNQKLVTQGLSHDELLNLIPQDVEVIGLSCMFSGNWLEDRELIRYLGAQFPNATIIAGGESITAMPDYCLKHAPALQICILGEGEETVVDLVAALQQRKTLDQVPGIVFKENGATKKTAKRERVKNVDEVPTADWTFFPKYEYEVQYGRKLIPILATRGCPYSCTFCTSPDMWGTRYYMRSPKLVADEIEQLKNQYGATSFDFFDLTAIIKKSWILEFAKILVDRKLDIHWRIPAGTRSEAIDEEVADWLCRSGCWSVTYAPESGSPKMLKLIKKKVVLSNMLQSMSYAHQQKMDVSINMILGLPDETHSDVWQTLRFLLQCKQAGVNNLFLAVFRPYPGSVLFERMIKEGKIQLDNDDYFVETHLIINTVFDSIFYNDLINKFWYRLYYFMLVLSFNGFGYLIKPLRLIRRPIVKSKAFQAKPENDFSDELLAAGKADSQLEIDPQYLRPLMPKVVNQ